jgi:adenosylcobinamide-GDP ribazoletransferase
MRLAVSTFTVLPVRPGPVDRGAAGIAMSVAPLVGAALGVALGGVALALHALDAPAPLLGALVVAVGLLLTRGLHVDGLADTVDALGSYGDRDRALRIMKSPEVGPFGVAAIVISLLIQATALAGLAGRPAGALLAGVATAAATGRLAVGWACRRGVPAARPDGLGALVAGTVGWPVLVVGTLAVAGLGLLAVPGRSWQGPVVVVLAVAVTALLLRHLVHRLGGITGDVLGALLEVAVTVTLAGLALG